MLKNKLTNLAKGLSNFNYTVDAQIIQNLIKIATEDLEAWKKVLEEAQKPIPPQIGDVAIKYLVNGAVQFYKVSEQLHDLPKEQLKELIHLTQKLPGISTANNLNFSEIQKVAGLSKDAQLNWLKSVIPEGGGAALKSIPYIGPIISGMLALKNLFYGLREYVTLVREAEQLGLSWIDTLYPERIEGKVSEISEDPDQLILALKTTKSARVFMDEGISFVINTIDGIKDLIFVFLEVLSFGGMGILDFGLSAFFAILEIKTEADVLPDYDRIINKITEIAENHIQKLTPLPDNNVDYSELSLEELDAKLEELNEKINNLPLGS